MEKLTSIFCLSALAGLLITGAANANNADKEITVQIQVYLAKNTEASVTAVGFMVENSRRGSLGASTTKMGPADKLYAFGIRNNNFDSVSCGSAKLTQNSFVKLAYNGKACQIAKIISN